MLNIGEIGVSLYAVNHSRLALGIYPILVRLVTLPNSKTFVVRRSYPSRYLYFLLACGATHSPNSVKIPPVNLNYHLSPPPTYTARRLVFG